MKTENYLQDPSSLPISVHRRRHRSRRNKKSPCTLPPINQKQTVLWVPAIPSWEKEFCLKNLGFFKWEEFLEAKRYIRLNEKVMGWDDSEAEEAFNGAKNRFFAAKQLRRPNDENSQYLIIKKLPDDLYIDEINWDDNPEEDPELDDDIPDTISSQQEEKDDDDDVPKIVEVSIEDIKPTGWDIDLEHVYDFLKPPDLTGLIVGN